MRRRSDNLNFWSVSKTKAAVMTVILMATWIFLAIVTAGQSSTCSSIPFGLAFLYGGRWLFCHLRDTKNVADARLARELEQIQSHAPLAAPKSQQFSPLHIPQRPE